MKRTQLSVDSQTFAICAEQGRGSSKADRRAHQRLETARRKLVRSIVRVCHTLSDDDFCNVAEYILLVSM